MLHAQSSVYNTHNTPFYHTTCLSCSPMHCISLAYAIMVCTNVPETWVCCVKRNWPEVMYMACAEHQKNVNHACCNVMLIVRSTWRQRWDNECEGWFAADFGVNVFSTAISGLVSWYAYTLCIVDCNQKFDSVLYHRADIVSYYRSVPPPCA